MSQNPDWKDQGKSPENGSPKRNRGLIAVVLLVLGALLITEYMGGDHGSIKLDRTKLLQWMSNPTLQIVNLELRKSPDGISLKGLIKTTGLERTPSGSPIQGVSDQGVSEVKFNSQLLELPDSLLQSWEAKRPNMHVEVSHDTSGWFGQLLGFLPVLLLIGFFWFMMTRQAGPGGGKGVFNFGKSRARLLEAGKGKTTFADVAGCDEAKTDLEEIVQFLKDPKKFDEMGAKIPKGALLLGPPGTGKTLLARAVAGEAGCNFYSMSGSDFVEMFVGVGASRVRDLFETGKRNAPCILFIDEIDAVGRQRGAGVGGGHDEREQTLNQLLVEMDGFEANEGVIVLAATNRSDVLDKALLRPGRFDRQIVVDAPDAKGREEILKVHLRKRKIPLGADVDTKVIAKGTPGLSGADIENLVNEAALMAARYNAKQVSMIDFEEAKDKIMIGPERRSRILTEEEKRTTAYHEAGHALVNHMVPHSDTLHKLTIIPRGMALGITFSLPEKDRYTLSKDYLLDEIAILLGGRAAEILFFNQYNSGASNDIQRATDIAYRMVTEWGMTEELGPICYSKKKHDPFLGRDLGETKNFSEETAVKIDAMVRQIIDEQMRRVHQLLQDNRETLQTLAEALLEHEVLDREEILAVLDGTKLESTKKSRQFRQMELVRIEKEILAERKDKEGESEDLGKKLSVEA